MSTDLNVHYPHYFSFLNPYTSDSLGGATSKSKMSKLAYYRHVEYTLALTCAKNCLIILCSFQDILENVGWSDFFGPPCIVGQSRRESRLGLKYRMGSPIRR